MRPRLPAWRNLPSQNEKCAYRYQNMTGHGPTKCLLTFEFEMRYALSKLTKQSDKLF